MDKVFVAQGVANRLFATEVAIDTALAEASQLVTEMVQARQELNASALLGNEALAKVAEAIATLSAARSAVVVAHNELAESKLRMGIRTKMAGFGDKDSTSLRSPGELRQVG